MEHAIETRDLTVRYPHDVGIEGITLAVERGERFGFLGKNGAGKTTTIRVLLDLLRPDRGSAALLGVDVRRGGRELRRRVGYLPGDLALPERLTGAQALNLFAALQGVAPLRRDAVLDRLGFPRAALARPVRGYSTGMRQMIGIAIAMQHAPELLILDEPTSGLDPVVRDAFLELVRDCPAQGQTVLLSSHVLDEVERCADRVAIVHRGRLRMVGRLDELRNELRRTSPPIATLTWRDGTRTVLHGSEGPEALLAAAHAAAARRPGELVDLDVRAPGLDALFRAVVAEQPPVAAAEGAT